MDCRDCQDRLSLYLDGQLTEAERLQVEAELDRCPDCARAFESLSLLVSDLNAIGPAPAPDGLLDELRAAFRAELASGRPPAPRGRRFFGRFRALPAVAAALLIGLTVFVMVEESRLEMPEASERALLEAEDGDRLAKDKEVGPAAGGLEGKSEEPVVPAEAGAPRPEAVAKKSVAIGKEHDDEEAEAGEERVLDHWGGFLDRAGAQVRKRGMEPVEPRAETEAFLDGATAAPAAEDGALGAPGAKAMGADQGEAPRLKDEGNKTPEKGVDEAKGERRGAGQAKPRSPDRSYLLLGPGSLAGLEAEARRLGIKLKVTPIVKLDGDEAGDDENGVWVELELARQSAEELIRRLEGRAGLKLRLYARAEGAASRPSDRPNSRLLLSFILPRP
ncbi:MAG: zf-HC2 domain-containing protein [Planctomycetes bacterium]|nr:zf-HC2 domain-containing protein [Planctomycetota bacterium]